MNILMRKSAEGLKNAMAGWHVPVAGATIIKKDLNKIFLIQLILKKIYKYFLL